MTQHPSLRLAGKGKKHRSVLKRRERIDHLDEKGEWDDTRSVFGLPKVKMVRIKAKKEKGGPAKDADAEKDGATLAATDKK